MTDIPKDILNPKDREEVKLPARKCQEIIPKQEKKKVKRFKTENLIERIKTFKLGENDILLIRFHIKVTQPIRRSIERLISEVEEFKGHFVLGIDSRMDLEAVPEIEFNKIGFYKKVVTWSELLEIKRKKKLTLIQLASPLFMTPDLIAKNLSDPKLENEPLTNKHLIELRKAKII